jgi:hypothetical protein
VSQAYHAIHFRGIKIRLQKLSARRWRLCAWSISLKPMLWIRGRLPRSGRFVSARSAR